MKLLPRKIICILIGAMALLLSSRAQADPFSDFFRRLGNSIAHPQKQHHKQTSAKTKSSPSPDESASPGEEGKRATSAGSDAKGKKRDLPYGIPVPNKPGFVTSPYSPNGGYVDVRGFPSGIEVKDPYTGKVFLTP